MRVETQRMSKFINDAEYIIFGPIFLSDTDGDIEEPPPLETEQEAAKRQKGQG